MSLEQVCSQYPIYRRLINNINSITDITNLITSSPSLYNNLHGSTIKKTINVPKNTLVLAHEFCDTTFEGRWVNINMIYKGEQANIEELYQHFLAAPKEDFEHINKIRIELCDFYDVYDTEKIVKFTSGLANFIDELFNLCPNAETFELFSIINVHFFIIKNLKSSKIKTIKGITFSAMTDFVDINHQNFLGAVNGLEGLNEFHIFVREVELYKCPYYMTIFKDILKHLSKKKDSKLVISGNVTERHINTFKDFLSFIKKFNVNISLEGIFLCHLGFFKTCIDDAIGRTIYPNQNITELNVSLWNSTLFQALFMSLPSFVNLKTLKIELNDQLFERMIHDLTEDIMFDKCFSPEILSKLSNNIEEFYLKIENWEAVYDEPDDLNKSYPMKDDAVTRILSYLKSGIKTLYLKGVPNLTKEKSDILTKNCPNVSNLYVSSLYSIDEHFFENMNKLTFLYIKGIHKVNIPTNVDMVFVYEKQNEECEKIAKMSDNESHGYFKYLFNRNFKISLRNCYENQFSYNVLFDNIFHWNIYLNKMNFFKQPF